MFSCRPGAATSTSFRKVEDRAEEPVGENLGQGKPTAGGEVREVNQSCETIGSLASPLASLRSIKARTVSPSCETEKKKSSTLGRLQRDSRRNREREIEKNRWITLRSGLGINAHLLHDKSLKKTFCSCQITHINQNKLHLRKRPR